MIKTATRAFVFLAAAATAVTSAEPALAHHLTGGRMPSTWGEGLLSGLGHPVIGLDHLAAIVAVGLLAAALRSGPILPLGFVVASTIGAALHVMAVDVPFAEAAVALTVLALGLLLLRGHSPSWPVVAVSFVLAGLFHGYAYGESIAGAEPNPLAAYFIGFTVIQCAIAGGAMLVARRLSGRMLIPGGAIAAVGLVFLAIAATGA